MDEREVGGDPDALLGCASCKLDGRDGGLRRRTWPAASGVTHCDRGHGPLGRVVGRRYLLLGPIAGGQGGWGSVHRALDLKLDRVCAVKLMLPGIEQHPLLVERFRREALTLAQLRHPNVVTVFDASVPDRGDRFIAMELVEGESLGARIERDGALAVGEAVRIALDIARGLVAIHEKDVVHRDLKPRNVVLSAGGAVIVDFGIARLARVDPDAADLSRGLSLGTHEYKSPEVVLGETAGAAADWYALGLVIFELVTGRRPFPGGGLVVENHHLGTPPPRLRDEQPLVPEALDELVQRLLEKSPAARPDGAEVVRLLESLALGASVPPPSRPRVPPTDAGGVVRERRDTPAHGGDRHDEVRQLLLAAFRAERPGDVLYLALERAGDRADLLVRAALHLRDLLAYPALREVCDRILAGDPEHVQALELDALALLRLRRGADATARARLERAHGIAGARGESGALLGRLHKQAWRVAWDDGEAPTAERVKSRIVAATQPGALHHLHAAIREYTDAHDETPGDPYPGLNAVTLLALSLTLADAEGNPSAAPEDAPGELDRLRTEVTTRLSKAPSGDEDEEARYWWHASRAELLLADAARQPGTIFPEMQQELRLAFRVARRRPFVLDSTLQQMRMLRGIGYRAPLTDRVLDSLNHQWQAIARPDLPARRVVFAGHRPDLPGRPSPRLPEALVPTVAAALRQVAVALGAQLGDHVVYLSGAAGGDLLFAEACQDAGIAYVLHLPWEESRFLETSVRPHGEPWVERYHRARDRALGTLVMADHVGPPPVDDPYGAVNRWMIASARAYGIERALLVALWDGEAGDGEGGTAAAVDLFRRAGGKVLRVPPDQPAGSSPPVLSIPAAPAVPPEADSWRSLLPPEPIARSAPAPVPEAPAWVHDLAGIVETAASASAARGAGAELRERWQRYLASADAVDLFRRLDLRFEPVESLVPRLPLPATLGFEVLAMLDDGRPYGQLLKEASTAGLDPIDLDLAVFVLGLQTINALRDWLARMVGRSLSVLQLTLNVNDRMLASPALRPILDGYFVRATASRVQLELSETFPEALRTTRDGPERMRISRAAVDELKRLVEQQGVQLVLDDNDQQDAGFRAAVRGLVVKIKTDARYSRNVFDLGRTGSPDAVVEELARFRVAGKPFVIEGVETADDYRLLQDRWPDDQGDTAMQGWCIRLREPLLPLFEPVSGDPAQPRGYRLGSRLRARIWPR